MSVIIDGTNGITTPPVALLGSTSGTISLVAPAVAGTNTQTLVAATGTLAPIVSATAVASTSGTAFDFTSIPSWVKRVTVMLSGVSTSGTSNILVQIGTGSVTTSGYLGSGCFVQTGTTVAINVTTGFPLSTNVAATTVIHGSATICLLSSNLWAFSSNVARSDAGTVISGAGSVTLAGTLDRLRITTVNGTDTFDAGTINIMYE